MLSFKKNSGGKLWREDVVCMTKNNVLSYRIQLGGIKDSYKTNKALHFASVFSQKYPLKSM